MNGGYCVFAVFSGKCGKGSVEVEWVVNDLKTHTNQCTLASWQQPLYSTFEKEPGTQQLWTDLYAYGTDFVLNGHIHCYERWGPQDAADNRDDTYGIRKFFVGTGGRSFQNFNGNFPANFDVGIDNTFGVLKLTLHTNEYNWQLIPAAVGTFTDSGSASCHGTPGSSVTGAPNASVAGYVAEDATGTSDHQLNFAGVGAIVIASSTLFGVAGSRRCKVARSARKETNRVNSTLRSPNREAAASPRSAPRSD